MSFYNIRSLSNKFFPTFYFIYAFVEIHDTLINLRQESFLLLLGFSIRSLFPLNRLKLRRVLSLFLSQLRLAFNLTILFLDRYLFWDTQFIRTILTFLFTKPLKHLEIVFHYYMHLLFPLITLWSLILLLYPSYLMITLILYQPNFLISFQYLHQFIQQHFILFLLFIQLLLFKEWCAFRCEFICWPYLYFTAWLLFILGR